MATRWASTTSPRTGCRSTRRRPCTRSSRRSRTGRSRCCSSPDGYGPGSMQTVEETPTEPVDFALLSATYSALLGTLVLASRDRGAEVVRPAEFVPLGIAAFALTKVVSREKIETWMREPFIEEGAAGRRPKGRRLRYAAGELLCWTRRLGAGSALGLTALRVTRPRESRVVTTVLATSAVNDWLFAGFAWLTSKS